MQGVFSILSLLAVSVQAFFPGCIYLPTSTGQPHLVCNRPLPPVPPPPLYALPPQYVVDDMINWNNQLLTNEQAWVHNHQNNVFQNNENALRFWWGNSNPHVEYFLESQREWKDYFQKIDENMLEGYKEYVDKNKWFG